MIRLNDLYDYSLKIFQDDDNFKFSLDSILLAESINLKKDVKIMDFCCGNASIPLILFTKGYKNIYGMEIQKYVYDIAVDSIKYNKLENYINIVNDNLNNCSNYFPGNNFDVVVCNPPYFKVNESSYINKNSMKAISRHEITTDLDSIISNAFYLLKDKGYFFIAHRVDRFQELSHLLLKYNFFIKNIYMIKTSSSNIDLIIIKSIKNGKIGCKCRLLDINGLTTYKNIFKETD